MYSYMHNLRVSKNDDEVLEIDNLILKTYLADVSTGCSSPPQGEMCSSKKQLVSLLHFAL